MHNYVAERTDTVIDRCLTKLVDHELVKTSNNVLFIFTPEKTFVATPFHLFLIRYSHRNYTASLRRLHDLALRGEIRTMSDLLDYNGLTPGANSQFYGLELVRMELSWVN